MGNVRGNVKNMKGNVRGNVKNMKGNVKNMRGNVRGNVENMRGNVRGDDSQRHTALCAHVCSITTTPSMQS